MPYFYDENLENQDENNQELPGSQVQISGASPTTDSEGSDSSGAQKQGLNTGSGFQNLDSYLKTNQSQQFGQQVLGKVGGEIDTAKQDQKQASDQFKSQVQDSNRIPDMGAVNSAIANPTGANKQEFQGWLNQTYQGPNSLAESPENWNKYWSGLNKANTSATLLGTEPGRFTLLDSYFGRPSYNFGEKSLDNLLVQQSGIGRDTRNLQNEAAQLKSQGQEDVKGLQNDASLRSAQVDQNRQQVRGAVGIDDQGQVITGDKAGAIGQQYKSVEDSIAKANLDRMNLQNQLRSDLGAGSLTDEELAQTGLSKGQNVYNVDLSKYLSNGGELSKNQVMTPEQQAYIRALSELSGVTDDFASGDLQAKTDPFSYNNSGLLSDIGHQKSLYEGDMKITPIEVGSPSGRTYVRPMDEVRQEIASTYQDIARGNDTNAGRSFLAYAEPALAKAEKALADKYQIGRTVGSYAPSAPSKVRMS